MLYFFVVAHKALCQTLLKAFFEVYEDMVEILLVLDIFFFSRGMRRLKICSVVLLPALKPACSSAMIFSSCGVNLFNMFFSMAFLERLMSLTVL